MSQPARRRPTIWTRPVRGSRGPRPDRSREEVARAAGALADGGGLPGVSMRALAEALGTSAGALYRYVRSRDELVDLMVDAALAELPPPPGGDRDPVEQLVQLARDLLAVHRRHPWLGEASLRPQAVPGPRALDWFENCLAAMADLPASRAAKMETVAVITGVVVLFTRQPEPGPERAVAMFSAATREAHPHLLAALTAADPGAPRRDLFERVIRGLVRALLDPDSRQ